MNPQQERARRIFWAKRGAVILALVSFVLGFIFSAFVALVTEAPPANGALGYWLGVVLFTVVLWGGGGAFFGAILGAFASMIWKPNNWQD